MYWLLSWKEEEKEYVWERKREKWFLCINTKFCFLDERHGICMCMRAHFVYFFAAYKITYWIVFYKVLPREYVPLFSYLVEWLICGLFSFWMKKKVQFSAPYICVYRSFCHSARPSSVICDLKFKAAYYPIRCTKRCRIRFFFSFFRHLFSKRQNYVKSGPYFILNCLQHHFFFFGFEKWT